MRIRFLPADEAGCCFYRMAEPARIAELEGHEVVVDNTYTIGRDHDGSIVAADQESRVIDGQEMHPKIEADVIVMQRPAKKETQELIRLFQAQGQTVIVDVDDDFSCLHAQHPFHDHFNPALNGRVNWQNLHKACAMADLVTVTTPALADRYGAHGRVAVLPNCVPQSLLEKPRWDAGRLTLGWTGVAEIHPGDLAVTHGGVAEALKRTGWRFRVVGKPDDVGEQLGIGQVEGTGFLGIDEWHSALGVLNVGIVPLGDTAFNAAKSYLKGIEFAARGVPFVASPLPEYEWLAEQGIGLLAPPRSRNWRAQLVRLMEDEPLRKEMAARGREIVAERHTYEGQGWKWQEAWDGARARHRVAA
jgi:hypothetical protein